MVVMNCGLFVMRFAILAMATVGTYMRISCIVPWQWMTL